MKKLFAIVAAGLMCLSSNAAVETLYICGPEATTCNGKALGWDIANPLPVELNRGKFVFTLQNWTDAIAISDKVVPNSSWGEWSTGLWAYKDAANLTESQLDQALTLEGPGAGNIALPWMAPEWTIEISADLKTITFKTSTPKPAEKNEYYLLGDEPLGWSQKPQYKLELEDGTENVYWLDIPEASKLDVETTNIVVNFVHNDVIDWGCYWGCPKPITLDVAEKWEWGTNPNNRQKSLNPGYFGTIKFIRPANGENADVTVYSKIMPHVSEAGVEGVTVEDNAPSEYFNLQGLRVAQPENGKLYIVRKGQTTSKILVK